MHFKWSQKILAEEPNENGYSTIEIDESVMIGNSNVVYWMFG